VIFAGHDRSQLKIRIARLLRTVVMPTEDYPGPTKSHPEEQDTNDPPRPANVDPERPALPEQPPSQTEEEEEEE